MRFYWSNFHEFISMEMMLGAKTTFMLCFLINEYSKSYK